jgi:hypothetical protein
MNPPDQPSEDQPSEQVQRFLLIPCLAAGMGAVLQGTVAGLMFAEYTGRVPFLYWHTNCKYLRHGAEPYHNAFEDFFQPVSPLDLAGVLAQVGSSFPSGTGLNNLHDVIDDYHHRLGEQEAHFENVCSEEAEQAELLVFPAYISIEHVLERAPKGSEFHGMELEAAAAQISGQQLIVRPEMTAQVEAFWSKHFADREHIVTVHIRGGDKYQEEILPSFSRYKGEVDTYLAKHPNAGIFLASDSSTAVEYFEKAYPGRVVTSSAMRLTGRHAVHKSGADGVQIGNEVIFDVECLSRGSHFIGFDKSNVYFWVCHISSHGQARRFSHTSVRSGHKEAFTSRQSFKSAFKQRWKRLFGSQG